MKNILYLLVILLITQTQAQDLVGVQSNSKKNLKGNSKKLLRKGYKYFGIESGSVISNNGDSTFTSKLYFDRFGLRQVKFEKGSFELNGVKTNFNLLVLRDGELNISIDLNDTTGMLLFNWYDEITTPEERILLEMEGSKKIDSQVILEKECEVWESQRIRRNSQTWIWKGIVLKVKSEIFNYQAEKVEIGHTLDSEYFEILSEVKIVRPTQDLR